MAKSSQLLPDSDGSKYMAWQPNLGLFDVRWAAKYTPASDKRKTYDQDLDKFCLLDLDRRYLC